MEVSAYFPKPIITSDLLKALNTMLNASEKMLCGSEISPEILSTPEYSLSWTQGVKLLLVEDNRVNQMVASGVLNKLGVTECVIAENGRGNRKTKIKRRKSSIYFYFYGLPDACNGRIRGNNVN